jgi:hypothetical protein
MDIGKLYLVQPYPKYCDECSNYKEIEVTGLYSSKEEAKRAISEAKEDGIYLTYDYIVLDIPIKDLIMKEKEEIERHILLCMEEDERDGLAYMELEKK